MPLHFQPSEKEVRDVNYHGNRRVFCDGCGMGASYEPQRWVYHDQAQIDSWVEEHKDHKPPKREK